MILNNANKEYFLTGGMTLLFITHHIQSHIPMLYMTEYRCPCEKLLKSNDEYLHSESDTQSYIIIYPSGEFYMS